MVKKLRSPIVVTLGHVDHGKCVTPETMIPLSDGRLLTAKEIYEEYKDKGRTRKIKEGVIVELKDGPKVFSFDGRKIIKRKVSHIWKIRAPEKLIKIKLASGDEITTTPEHPFLVFTSTADISEKKAKSIEKGDFIVVPRILNFESSLTKVKEEIIHKLKNIKDFVALLDENKSEKFLKKLLSSNLQELRRMNLFTTDPYTSVSRRKFRVRDLISLSEFFGFSSKETYEMIHSIKSASEKRRAGHTSNWMKLPKSEEEFRCMGYVLGCLAGDGYVIDGRLNNNDKNVQSAYRRAVEKAFGLKTKVVRSHTCDVVITNGGRTFGRFLTDVIGFPKKNKSANIRVPEIIQSHLPTIKGFISGWVDTDGYVSHLNNCIEVTSKSKKLVKQVATFLLAFGTHSKIYEKNGYFTLRIANKPYLERFLSNFNLHSKQKVERIKEVVRRSSTSRIFDLTPFPSSFLNSIKGNLNKKIPYFSVYKKYRRLSRPFLEKLVAHVTDSRSIKKIREFLNLDVSIVKVISKEEVKNKFKFVYDFTVPETHNFIAERVIVHNTTLLDRVRGTSVNLSEPGQLTQHIGASFIPVETIRKICGNLLRKFKVELTIPGILVIDTPGHEAFTTLRKRGGSVADLAILVIDINEGFKPQTDESLEYLKQFKVPFVVAATKVDLIYGWVSNEDACFLDSYANQGENVKTEVENKVYRIVAQLSERGFEAERFDRVTDFTKQVAIVPCSGKTGEGVPELLAVLAGLAQKFLKEKLIVSDLCRGNVLEVKEVRGLGTTIDVIIYDGSVKVGDYIIIGGKEPIVTRIKALLRPPALKELRVEKQFENVKEVSAAAGIKIAAPNLESVIAGSPFVCVSEESKIEEAKKLVQQEVEEVEFHRDIDGVIVKADTLGSLEALIKLLKDKGVPIRKAEVGKVNKQDVVEAQNVKDGLKKVILAFNVKPLEEAKNLARDLGIRIFTGNIIYRLIEDYEEWCKGERLREVEEKLKMASRPCKVRFLPGFIFRRSKPAIFGIEVLAGVIKPNTLLMREDGKVVGKVKNVQREGRNVQFAKTGDKVAISIEEAVVGRHIKEGDVLISYLTQSDIEALREAWDKLHDDEKELLKEWKLIKP